MEKNRVGQQVNVLNGGKNNFDGIRQELQNID